MLWLRKDKKKKKKMTKKELRRIEVEDKILKNNVMIPLYFWIKMIFNQSEGIEPGIEKALKTCSTNREEIKKESNQGVSFGLKTAFFRSFDQSRLKKSENFENLEFSKETLFKTRFYDMKCMSMIPNVFKNHSLFNQINFYQDSKNFS